MSTKPEESDLLASLKAALGGKGVKEAREAAEDARGVAAAGPPPAPTTAATSPVAAPAPAAPATPPAPIEPLAPAAPAEAGTSPGVAAGAGGGPAAVVATPVEEAVSPEELQAAEERARFLSALRSCEDILNAPQPQER